MKSSLHRQLLRVQDGFSAFTAPQKVMAVLGSLALLLAGFMAFRWASAPSYAPLYSNLSAADASAVVDKLDSTGVPHRISNGGATILVPQDRVYETRIQMSGEGIPTGSDNGYSILDKQGLSTSSFQEQTNFKRAMEGELNTTIKAIDGVTAAVVHLALPAKEAFTESQDPATASVLLKMKPGAELSSQQVSAVTNLVASSVDGLKPGAVTVADSSGRVLSAADGAGGAVASARFQQVEDFQETMRARVQAMLDRVVGPGNATAQVTADLDFDQTKTTTTRFFPKADTVPLRSSSASETYAGPGGSGGSTGVVGPDGQMDSSTTGGTGGSSSYKKQNATSDNAVDTTVEQREAAPGGVTGLHVAVVLDAAKAAGVSPSSVESLLSAGLGIQPSRGDTVQVSSIKFDRTLEAKDAAELEAAASAAGKARMMSLARTAGLVLLLAGVLVAAVIRNRRRDQARLEATSYVVEQLRKDAVERAQAPVAVEPSPALAALERADDDTTSQLRDEISALVERQPDDVAALLRGWLVESS